VKKLTVHIVVVVVALAFAATAFAGSLTTTYGGAAGTVQTQVNGAVTKTHAATKGATAGTLPFTGMDLTLIVAGGVVLLVAGLGLRRFGRDKA
jgi:uncharacterized membrane protein YjjP (DUF1212 family)